MPYGTGGRNLVFILLALIVFLAIVNVIEVVLLTK
jgi:hypothetical protein